MTQTIKAWRTQAVSKLAGNFAHPQTEADALLGLALGQSRAWLITHDQEALSAANRQRLAELLAQREDHVPLAYLRGRCGFMDFELDVTSATLVPRGETELLVDVAVRWLKERPTARAIDLGTGSGAIAIAVARARPDIQIIATDVSDAAIAVANSNAAALGVDNIEFRTGSWWTCVDGESFDLVLSNPPYVEADFEGFADNLKHEPISALASGADGLDDIKTIVSGLRAHLASDGIALIEHGHMQAAAVQRILRSHQFNHVCCHQDLAGLDRFTQISS